MSQTHPIRICLVSPSIYPLMNPMARAPFSDAEQQLYELARCFGGDDYIEINVLTGDFDQDEVEYYSGVLVFRGNFDRQRTFFQRMVRKQTPLRDLLEKIDAHGYMMAGASGIAKDVAEFCQSRRRAFIFRVTHQRDCDGTFVHGDPAGKDFRWALQKAALVLCQTQEQKRILQRTENITAILVPDYYPVIDSSETPRTDVLWIGEAAEWKQPELFFRLALTIPPQNFTMLTRPGDLGYFEKLVSKTRDVPNLGFENSVPYSEWDTYLKRAKLLVNTSRYEGFPYAFTQAFAYGVPVASLNLNPDKILETKQLGVCANGSEVNLAQGVSDLLAYPRQWKRFNENVLNFAHDDQNPRQIAETYRKLFIKCAGMTKRKRGK